ncbi:MAG: hypothetical protein Q8R59_00080 [Polaromonas sp.]|nr:hypothetical protein [Polaromonas sp.]
MNTSGKRKLRIALVLGVVGVAVAWIFLLLSPQHRLASELIRGPEVRAAAGVVDVSFPSSFRLAGDRSSMAYYVVGSNRRGFLKVILEKSDDGLRVTSAVFDDVPLAIAGAPIAGAAQ